MTEVWLNDELVGHCLMTYAYKGGKKVVGFTRFTPEQREEGAAVTEEKSEKPSGRIVVEGITGVEASMLNDDSWRWEIEDEEES